MLIRTFTKKLLERKITFSEEKGELFYLVFELKKDSILEVKSGKNIELALDNTFLNGFFNGILESNTVDNFDIYISINHFIKQIYNLEMFLIPRDRLYIEEFLQLIKDKYKPEDTGLPYMQEYINDLLELGLAHFYVFPLNNCNSIIIKGIGYSITNNKEFKINIIDKCRSFKKV